MRCRPPIVLVSVAAAVLLLSGCQQKVTVETGERVVGTYGEVVTDTVKSIEVPADQASRYGVVERHGDVRQARAPRGPLRRRPDGDSERRSEDSSSPMC